MEDSISEWFRHLKTGDADAAQKLWKRYALALEDLARKRLNGLPKNMADEEDLALSVFSSICRGAAAGRFADVNSRDELWWLLLSITKQKTVDHIRRETAQKRGLGRVQSETGLAGGSEGSDQFKLDDLISPDPTPEFLVMLEEQFEGLLALLPDDRLRQIAIYRVEGYTVPEIAKKLGIGKRAIERKLQLIRSVWSSELFDQDAAP
jgi:DNA-directed RNA polymerase specialized sigma24 family protein